ncbi:hypothetical protein ACHAXA_005859 [Cyclostephanos tholiformis]|uniref:SURF1-like protein n=1 Tax=Cyclostephanos tholiformis TaxID=382380 RepID=A0ABD3RD40_9STRA
MSSFVVPIRPLLLRVGSTTARSVRSSKTSSSSSCGGGGGGFGGARRHRPSVVRCLSSANDDAVHHVDDGGGPSLLGGAFFSSLCLLTFGLGSWQTMRYLEKVDMVERREYELGLDPLPNYEDWLATTTKTTTTTTTTTGEVDHDDDANGTSTAREGTRENTRENLGSRSYRRVLLRGEYQHHNEILVGPRGPPPGALAITGPNSGRGGGGGMSSSVMGYIVVTPFVIASDDESDVDDGDAVRRTTARDATEPSRERGWYGRIRGGRTTTKIEPSSDSTTTNDVSTTNDGGGDGKGRTIVWINRGWIPRHFVNDNHRVDGTTSSSWERPSGIVRLMAMESDTESPGMFAPPSRVEVGRGGGGRGVGVSAMNILDDDGSTNATSGIKRLLWLDRVAMEEMTSSSSSSSSSSSCGGEGDRRSTHLFVEIDTTSVPDKDKVNAAKSSFPAKASREYVGEFKVTPAVHAGYAFTWFGLSSAGIVMTRRLLSRGR